MELSRSVISGRLAYMLVGASLIGKSLYLCAGFFHLLDGLGEVLGYSRPRLPSASARRLRRPRRTRPPASYQ